MVKCNAISKRMRCVAAAYLNHMFLYSAILGHYKLNSCNTLLSHSLWCLSTIRPLAIISMPFDQGHSTMNKQLRTTFGNNMLAIIVLHSAMLWTISEEMHQPGIEPGSHRWQRCILPLDHWCMNVCHDNNLCKRQCCPSRIFNVCLQCVRVALCKKHWCHASGFVNRTIHKTKKEGTPGFEPGTCWSAVSRSNHWAMYPCHPCHLLVLYLLCITHISCPIDMQFSMHNVFK